MIIEQIIGIVVLVIGLFGLIYVFKVYSKFLKELRTGFAGIAFGILSGYLSILSLTLYMFEIISENLSHILALSFLGIAAILIALGSNKMSKVLTDVNKKEGEKENE